MELRKGNNLAQRNLARQLQLTGIDIDELVIIRIVINNRYVTDLELKDITDIF